MLRAEPHEAQGMGHDEEDFETVSFRQLRIFLIHLLYP